MDFWQITQAIVHPVDFEIYLLVCSLSSKNCWLLLHNPLQCVRSQYKTQQSKHDVAFFFLFKRRRQNDVIASDFGYHATSTSLWDVPSQQQSRPLQSKFSAEIYIFKQMTIFPRQNVTFWANNCKHPSWDQRKTQIWATWKLFWRVRGMPSEVSWMRWEQIFDIFIQFFIWKKNHFWIYSGGSKGAHDPISFIFMQFSAKILPNWHTALVLWEILDPPLRNSKFNPWQKFNRFIII